MNPRGRTRVAPARPGPARSPTVIDVAELAGVSTATVSRVLSGAKRVSPDMQASVLAAVDRLGYRVNQAARSLRTTRSATVGLLVPEMSDRGFAGVIEQLDARLHEQGIGLLVGSSGCDPAGDRLVLDLFASHGVGAMIVAPASDRDPAVVAALRRTPAPVLLLDRDVPRLPADAVLTDHRAGLAAAVTHLTELGHERIGLICASAHTRPGRELASAYRHEVLARGLPGAGELLIQRERFDAPAGAAAFEALHRARATAVVLSGPPDLLVGVLAAVDACGLSVPEDLSLIAHTDPTSAALVRPALSAIVTSTADEGRLAAELTLSRLDQPDRPPRREVVPTRFVPARTTARARGRS